MPPSVSSAVASSAGMLALAAARLGFKCHIFSPNPDSPAFDVAHRVHLRRLFRHAGARRFAADVDVVTYEFENVPAETATFLRRVFRSWPDPKILATTQDRLAEKKNSSVRSASVSRPSPMWRSRPGLRRRSSGSDGRRCSRRAVSVMTAKVRRHQGRQRSTCSVARSRRPSLHPRSVRAVRTRGLGHCRARP